MKKAFIIIVSLFLVFMCFSCTKKNTSIKEQPKQVEKTPEQEPTGPVTPDPKEPDDPTLVTPDPKEPDDPTLVNPDEQEPVEPIKPKVKHKITYNVPDYVKVDGLPTEYVEGEGLESIGEPVVKNSEDIDKRYELTSTLCFAYWYIYDEEHNNNQYFSEVVMSIGPEETRDFVLTPYLDYLFKYRERLGKYAIDVKEKMIYPFATHACFNYFPYLNYYGYIKIDKDKKVEKVIEDNTTYCKVYFDLLHIYDCEYLNINEETDIVYTGNSYYVDKESEYCKPYFLYMEDSIYEDYKNVDEFIIPLNKYKQDINYLIKEDKIKSIIYRFPSPEAPISIIKKYDSVLSYYVNYFNFYPIVDGMVYIKDQSKFSQDETLVPYIFDTYRYLINSHLSDNPTFEEFVVWIKESAMRVYERTKYGQGFMSGIYN